MIDQERHIGAVGNQEMFQYPFVAGQAYKIFFTDQTTFDGYFLYEKPMIFYFLDTHGNEQILFRNIITNALPLLNAPPLPPQTVAAYIDAIQGRGPHI